MTGGDSLKLFKREDESLSTKKMGESDRVHV